MAKPKTRKSRNIEKKVPVISSSKEKKKKKAQKLKLSKVVKGNNVSLLDPPSHLVSGQQNVRQSVFNCKVSDVTKTRVDSSCVSILKPNLPDQPLQMSPVYVPAPVEDHENMYLDFLQSVKFFTVCKNTVISICEYPDTLYFHGVLRLSVLYGSAEVLGFTFTDRTPRSNVFSLKDSGILHLIMQKNSKSVLNIRELREKMEERCPYIKAQVVDSIITNMKSNSVLLLLEKSKDTNKMETFLNTHCKSSIFPTKSSVKEKLIEVSHSEELKKIERELTCQFLHPLEPEKFFNVSDQWQQLIDRTQNSAVCDTGNVTLLAGGKGVGKSTLLRYLINKCLSGPGWKKVLLIDLDPGQCELTLPGCLSVHVVNKPLLGPNFSHLNHSGRLWFLGDINVTQCFDKYLNYLEQILNYCASNAEFRHIPWFINSMGFCKGLGVELISCIISYFRPTHVIQIQSKKENNNYPDLLTSEIVQKYKRFIKTNINRVPGDITHNLSVVSSVSNINPNATNPPERRGAVILSYFSEILPKPSSALTAVVPFVTEVASLQIIVCHASNLNRAQCLAAINGNLVALCCKDSNSSYDHKCFGFGIVRGIDFADGRLYLLTPLQQELKQVNCLMMGNIFLPPSIFLQSHSSGHVPYVNVGEGQITSRITKRTFKPASTVSFQERFRNESRMQQS